MRKIVRSRGFALAELALVLASGLVWYAWPDAGWLPLLVALFPWLLRVTIRKFPFKRTIFDLPLAVFLLTAAVGVWAAYNREAAWQKFWILAGAVLLFYALARQPRENLWPAAGLIAGVGALISLYFLLTYDWRSQPTDLNLLGQVASWWMSFRPPVPLPSLPPNTAGGVLAMLLPFPFALTLRAWSDRGSGRGSTFSLLYAILAGSLVGIGLLMSSSRGAWLALAGASGFWLLWEISGQFASRSHTSQEIFFLITLALIAVPFIYLVFKVQGGILGLANSLPGMPSGSSRLEIARNTLYLVGDFPFTGGGLSSFPGLYSQYMMNTPYFLFAYSHNFYLDLLLEQGIAGFCAGLIVLFGGAWLAFSAIRVRRGLRPRASAGLHRSTHLLRWAVLAGLLVLFLHGFVDDPVYGETGLPLLFMLPGFAITLAPSYQSSLSRQAARQAGTETSRSRGWNASRPALIAGTSLLVLLIPLSIVWFRPALGSWYADLGAVLMARSELSGWPTGKWEDGQDLSGLNPARAYFQRALLQDGVNRTALYRLGLIEMQQRDFMGACSDLNQAHRSSKHHRGIQKALGYCYTWSGEYKKATGLLAGIPEAEYEMHVYTWWWQNQGRRDLAEQAREMEARLHSMNTSEKERKIIN